MSIYHIPVLLHESIDGLNIKPDGLYVDATFGGGGYSAEILKKLDGGRLFAFDMDADTSVNMPESDKFFFILGNFRFIKNHMDYYGIQKLDGIVADLGVSSHHFDEAERGFTYRTAARLDMRMNPNSSLSAEEVINEYDEIKLSRVFRDYGELRQAGRMAKLIVNKRKEKRIVSNMELVNFIKTMVPGRMENQFLSQVFQAIRIEVNQELENLKIFLHGTVALLKSGGRLVIVSYHSLEDRIVKNFMRWGKIDEPPQKDVFGKWDLPFNVITRKPMTPSSEEINSNPRARSARLRIAVKI